MHRKKTELLVHSKYQNESRIAEQWGTFFGGGVSFTFYTYCLILLQRTYYFII